MDLIELYNYVNQNKEIPHRSNDKTVYRPFKSLIEKSICDVPDKTGWYYWVDINGGSRSIYIGKSDSNTTYNLYKRIEEELSEEYLALWATVFDEQEMFDLFSSKYNHKYINNHKRALKKKGVTHILWVACSDPLDKNEIDIIESNLIQHFKPEANQQKTSTDHRPSKLFNSVKTHFHVLLSDLVGDKAGETQ